MERNSTFYITIPGAILEISLRVGVIPAAFYLDTFSDYLSKLVLFKELLLLYCVWNFAYIIALDWFEDKKKLIFVKKFFFVQFKGWSCDHCDL